MPETLTLHIPDMSCGHCRQVIDTAIKSVDPAAAPAFDADARVVTLSTAADIAVITKALSQAGYAATPA